MLTLKGETRSGKISSGELKKTGKIPAVFYGFGVTSTPIVVAQNEFKMIWKKAGESSIITLKVGSDDRDVLLHDIQVDPITDEPIHVDFYVVDKNKKVTVKVPLEFVGTSRAVKELGGSLLKIIHELEIECLPKDLPHEISVDISSLSELNSHISIKDLVLPSGVTALGDANDTVVSAVPQHEEVIEEKPAEIDLAAIEVEKKGKKDEEGAEGGEDKK